VESACVAASLQALTKLTSLTRLRVHGYGLPEGCCISPTVVNAWSHWTSLRDLDLAFNNRKLEDVLVLTQLRSLRALSIDGGLCCQHDRLEVQVGRAFAKHCSMHGCVAFLPTASRLITQLRVTVVHASAGAEAIAGTRNMLMCLQRRFKLCNQVRKQASQLTCCCSNNTSTMGPLYSNTRQGWFQRMPICVMVSVCCRRKPAGPLMCGVSCLLPCGVRPSSKGRHKCNSGYRSNVVKNRKL